MHDSWRCDGLNQCGDWSDEKYCNGSQPIPTTPAPPTPAPHAGGGGSGGIFLNLHGFKLSALFLNLGFRGRLSIENAEFSRM